MDQLPNKVAAKSNGRKGGLLNYGIPSYAIRFPFKDYEFAFIAKEAGFAEIGGISYVRTTKEDREENLTSDQLSGQMGQAALHLYWFGSFKEYAETRLRANLHPRLGDGGMDLDLKNVDIKTSKIVIDRSVMSEHLIVSPNEYRKNWVYIKGSALHPQDGKPTVWIIGWALSKELELATEGYFAGKYILGVPKLHRLPPVVHFVRLNLDRLKKGA